MTLLLVLAGLGMAILASVLRQPHPWAFWPMLIAGGVLFVAGAVIAVIEAARSRDDSSDRFAHT